MTALALPGNSAELGVTERDLQLGEQPVLDLAADWNPDQYHDEFKAKLEELVGPSASAARSFRSSSRSRHCPRPE